MLQFGDVSAGQKGETLTNTDILHNPKILNPKCSVPVLYNGSSWSNNFDGSTEIEFLV